MKFKKTCDKAKLPERAYNSAGYDLFSAGTAVLYRDQVVKVHTGIAVEIPPGHVGIVKGRSSLECEGITVVAGVIDEDYRGEILVCLRSHKPWADTLPFGKKIAQLLVVPVHTSEIEEVDELPMTERGEQGFGSSGK